MAKKIRDVSQPLVRETLYSFKEKLLGEKGITKTIDDNLKKIKNQAEALKGITLIGNNGVNEKALSEALNFAQALAQAVSYIPIIGGETVRLEKIFSESYNDAKGIFELMYVISTADEKGKFSQSTFKHKFKRLEKRLGIDIEQTGELPNHLAIFTGQNIAGVAMKDVQRTMSAYLQSPWKKSVMTATLVRAYEYRQEIISNLKELKEYMTALARKVSETDALEKDFVKYYGGVVAYITELEQALQNQFQNPEQNILMNFLNFMLNYTKQDITQLSRQQINQDNKDFNQTIQTLMKIYFEPVKNVYSVIVILAQSLVNYYAKIAELVVDFDDNAYDNLLRNIQKNVSDFQDKVNIGLDLLANYTSGKISTYHAIFGPYAIIKERILEGSNDANRIQQLLLDTSKKSKTTPYWTDGTSVQLALKQAFRGNNVLITNGWFEKIQGYVVDLTAVSLWLDYSKFKRIPEAKANDIKQRITSLQGKLKNIHKKEGYHTWEIYSLAGEVSDLLKPSSITDLAKNANQIAPKLSEFLAKTGDIMSDIQILHKIFSSKTLKRIRKELKLWSMEVQDSIAEQEQILQTTMQKAEDVISSLDPKDIVPEISEGGVQITTDNIETLKKNLNDIQGISNKIFKNLTDEQIVQLLQTIYPQFLSVVKSRGYAVDLTKPSNILKTEKGQFLNRKNSEYIRYQNFMNDVINLKGIFEKRRAKSLLGLNLGFDEIALSGRKLELIRYLFAYFGGNPREDPVLDGFCDVIDFTVQNSTNTITMHKPKQQTIIQSPQQ